MEYDKAARNAVREGTKGCASGCLTHFLVAVAATILLGSGAYFKGLPRRTIFVIVLVAIFLVAVLIPWAKDRRQL